MKKEIWSLQCNRNCLNEFGVKSHPKENQSPHPEKVPKREPVTPPPTLPIKIPKKQPTTVPEKVLWSELPFAEEGPEPDLEGALKKTLRKMRKTPQYLKQRYQPKGGQVGIHQEKSKKNQRVLFGVVSLNPWVLLQND